MKTCLAAPTTRMCRYLVVQLIKLHRFSNILQFEARYVYHILVINSRDAKNTCDVPEYCDGVNAECTVDQHLPDGLTCPDDENVSYSWFF